MKYLLALAFTTSSICMAQQAQIPANLISRALSSYATSIGCNFIFDKKSITSYDIDKDGLNDFIALYSIDAGCAGGSGTTITTIAVLKYRDEFHKEDIYVSPELSPPAAYVYGAPRFIDQIFVRNGQLWYSGKVHKEGDANNFPSQQVFGQLTLISLETQAYKGITHTSYFWKSSINYWK